MALRKKQEAQQKAGAGQPDDVAASDYPAGDCKFTADWGTVTAQISSDSMKLTFFAVTAAHPQEVVDAEKIIALLRVNRIVYGLAPEKIASVAARVDGVAGWSGTVVVARGRPPGIPGRLKYTAFGPEAEVKVASVESWEVNGKALHFGPVTNFFQQSCAPGEDPEFKAKAIRAGEVMAILQDPLEGKPGSDIFGRALKAPQFCELLLGDNVNLGGMRRFTATLFGYMAVASRRLSVLSPIIVSDDDMTAWYVNLPQFPPFCHPSPADVCQALTAAGVTHGLLNDNIGQLCKDLQEGRAPVWNVVARGIHAVPGEDGHVSFSVDRDKVAGKIRENGSMDMRELNLVQTVEEGDLIAVLYPPTPGQTGFTLRGLELETVAGQELMIDAKEHVRVESGNNGTIRFYAEQPGLIVYKKEQIIIEPLYLVRGNVDFSTGNIDVDCNLQIEGAVCSDFIVKSTKNVLVGGAVEPGAKILVAGDLEIKGGILGETTEVTVLGNLQAEYIQGAKVVVKGDAHIRQYIYCAFVRSIGAIEVGPGSGERGGSIAGGTVCSSATITAKSCGSPSNVEGILNLEPHPKKMANLKELRRALKECRAHLKMVWKTLNLESLDLKELQALVEGAVNPEAKEVYGKFLVDVQNTLGKIDELQRAKDTLKKKMMEDVDCMRISITQNCYGNTLIRIFGKELLYKNDRGATSFIFKDGEVVGQSGKSGSDLDTLFDD